MSTPQCPECGRFLASAFVEQTSVEPAPCPGCGSELSLAEADEGSSGDATTPREAPPVPPPAATLPAEGAAGGAATPFEAVEPEPATSVRPPDLEADRDPLAGWDQSPTTTATAQPGPVAIAASAGLGLVVGLLLGGRDRRGPGALLGAALGAVLGAVLARLRS